MAAEAPDTRSREQREFDDALEHISRGDFADAEERIAAVGAEAMMDILRDQVRFAQKVRRMLQDRHLPEAAKIIKGTRFIGVVRERMQEELLKYEGELSAMAQVSLEEGKRKRAERTLKHLCKKRRKELKTALSEQSNQDGRHGGEQGTVCESVVGKVADSSAPEDAHVSMAAPADGTSESPDVAVAEAVERIDADIREHYWNRKAPRGLTGRQRAVLSSLLREQCKADGNRLSIVALHALTGLKKGEAQKIVRDMQSYLLRNTEWEVVEDAVGVGIKRREATREV